MGYYMSQGGGGGGDTRDIRITDIRIKPKYQNKTIFNTIEKPGLTFWREYK